MQLDALLRSVFHFSKNFFDKISVIYTYSNFLHYRSYKKLINQYQCNVSFYKESIFYSFSRLVQKVINENYSHVLFMTDDDIVFKHLSLSDKKFIIDILENETVCTFSLRLGLNCTYSHPANLHFKLKNYQIINNEYLMWNWREQDPGDFSYPLSLDGHIFTKNTLLPILSSFKGKNPNVLESFMQNFLSIIPNKIYSFIHSKMVGVPVNRVSISSSNHYGKKFFYDNKLLAKKYLQGYIIDFHKMNFENIYSAHQELELFISKNHNNTLK